MAASLNKVYLLGNLTRNPDMRSTPSGMQVCEMGLAVSRRISSDREPEVCFVDITAWGKTAELCGQYLEKGSQVLVEGRLQLDQWEDRNGGGKRSKLRVVADQVQFIGRRGDGASGAYDNGAPQQQYQQPRQGGYGRGGAPQPYQGQMNPPPQYGTPQPYNAPQQPYGAPGAPPAMPEGAFNPSDELEDDIPF